MWKAERAGKPENGPEIMEVGMVSKYYKGDYIRDRKADNNDY